MSTPHDAPTNPMPAAKHAARPTIARLIRTLAIPVIIGWIVIIAVLNVIVPQLEAVGKMRSVSMSPENAPSMISMKRIGSNFQEFDSNTSAMIVLEGQQPLG